MKYLKGLIAAGGWAVLVGCHAPTPSEHTRVASIASEPPARPDATRPAPPSAGGANAAGGVTLELRSQLGIGYPSWTDGLGFRISPHAQVVHAADFNGDGMDDLAAIVGPFDPAGASRLLRWQRDAGGAFAAPSEIILPGAGGHAAHVSADLDGDGHRELVVARAGEASDGTSLQVLYLRGGGLRIDELVLDPVHGRVRAFASADVDRDGDVDLLALAVLRQASAGPQRISLLTLRNSAGTLELQGTRTIGEWTGARPPWQGLATGDFNGDARADLAVYWAAATTSAADARQTAPDEGALQVLLGDGVAGFGAPRTLATPRAGVLAASLVAGDFDGDGRDDLAGLAPRERFLDLALFVQGVAGLEATPRMLASTRRVEASAIASHDLFAADMDGNLRRDILTRLHAPGDVIGLHRQSAGVLDYGDAYTSGTGASLAAALGHLDDDGCPELVLATPDGLDILGTAHCPGERAPPMAPPLPPMAD